MPPENITNTEAMVGADEAPALSISNWPGDTATVAPPARTAETGGDATKTPAASGTPPATVETPPAEGEGGEAGEGDPPATEGGEAGAGEGEGTAAGAKPADRSLSGRLGQRTRERNEIRAERDTLAGLLEKALDKLGDGAAAAKPADPAAPGAAAAPAPERPDPRPRRDAFDDPDAFDDAVDAWSNRQTQRVVTAELARQETARQARETTETRSRQNREFHQQRTSVWDARVAELEANAPTADFKDKAYSQEVPVTDPMAAMLLTLDRGPDVLLYLADHPDEAKEIAAIANEKAPQTFNPQVAFAELYAIQKRLGKTGLIKAQVSKLPPPITPVRNANRAAPKDANTETMDEYGARRGAELQAQRRGSMFGNKGATH